MNQIVETICKALSEKKGLDIKIFHVTDVTSIADYFIVGTSMNKKHGQSLADNVEIKLQNDGIHALHKEGYKEGDWILMDFSNVILHIFSYEERQRVQLDQLWQDAPVEVFEDNDGVK